MLCRLQADCVKAYRSSRKTTTEAASMWGRMASCGRLSIGLQSGGSSAPDRRVINPPQDAILPHSVREVK